tara:strand:- start:318 stop:2126 length:1809 start_codon:yes stop_codon:yes gene_type:complete
MTNSYNIPLAPIVDTYVPEPTVQPKTGATELAEILSTVNPNLIKFAQQRQEKADEIQEQRAMEIIIQSDKKGLKKYIDALNKTEGPEAARQVIGRNRAFKAGIEKQVAIRLGSMAETDAKKFFNNYTVERELPDGTIQQLPLSQFSPESEEYQTALAEFNETSRMNVKGIRALYLNDYYLPQLGKGLQKVEIDHTKNYNEYLVQQAENNIGNVLKLNFYKRDDNQESLDKGLIDLTGVENPSSITGTTISKNTSQSYLNELESNGLKQAITPTKMIDVGISIGNSIYNEYQKKGLDGIEAVNEFWEYFGELEVGVTQQKKDGTIVRTKLKDIISRSEDIRKFRTDLITTDEKLRKDENARQVRKDQETILNRIKEFGVNNIVEMDKLANEFPDQFEDFLEPIIESQAVDRDTWFFDFESDIRFNGKYELNPQEGFKDLATYRKQLGSSVTDEDEREFSRLQEILENKLGVPIDRDLSQRIADDISDAEALAGEKNVLGIITFDGSKARKFFKIRDDYKRNIRKIATDDEKTQDEKLELYAVEREKLFDKAEKIKGPIPGKTKTVDEIIKEAEAEKAKDSILNNRELFNRFNDMILDFQSQNK